MEKGILWESCFESIIYYRSAAFTSRLFGACCYKIGWRERMNELLGCLLLLLGHCSSRCLLLLWVLLYLHYLSGVDGVCRQMAVSQSNDYDPLAGDIHIFLKFQQTLLIFYFHQVLRTYRLLQDSLAVMSSFWHNQFKFLCKGKHQFFFIDEFIAYIIKEMRGAAATRVFRSCVEGTRRIIIFEEISAAT